MGAVRERLCSRQRVRSPHYAGTGVRDAPGHFQQTDASLSDLNPRRGDVGIQPRSSGATQQVVVARRQKRGAPTLRRGAIYFFDK